MLNEEDFSSDSSDEDFIPEGIVESEDDDEGNDDEEDASGSEDDEDESPAGKRKKLNKNAKRKRRKKTKAENTFAVSVQKNLPATEEVKEEDKAKSESRAKDLWDDFLADVEKPPEEPKPKSKNSWAALLHNKKKGIPASDSTQSKGGASQGPTTKAQAEKPSEPSTVKVTQIFEFAGEEVRVEKEVAADSEEAKASQLSKNGSTSQNISGAKRPRSAGLSSLVNLLDTNKPKLSTLEKTKMDWNSFKSSEGIQEELSTHLKSKAG